MESWLSLFRSSPCPLLHPTPTPSYISSTTCPEKHDVFLSFRGEDTRNNFTSHLYEALCSKQIETFIDDEELDRGEEISPLLLKAIEQSKLSVIIFSKNYASSKWCLDELVKILESKEKNGQIVIPVFYHVDPSNVRKQCGNYALFPKHWRLIFHGNMDKLQKWKAALNEAANLSGWDSMNIVSEAQLVKRVVEDILQKLNRMSQDGFNFNDLVGIDKHIVKIESLLQIGSSNIRIVGIWGMGGIGKTTIADVVFTKLISLFESCCFVANVREQVERFGLNYVRDKYLSDLLEQENLHIGTPNMGFTFVKARLRRKKVLVVFDDVDGSSQLEYLLGTSGDGCFSSGSRVMVTSRDRQVLLKVADEIYKVPEMDFDESLQLFSLNAFKQDNPMENFMKLSERMVDYCGGNPLALKVLGSFLYGRSKEEWESALKKLEETPHKDIQKVLKLSYDGLDDKEKAIFLDITCCFEGNEILSKIIRLLGDSAIISIRILIDLSLVAIQDNGSRVEIHDLLKTMGREIVRQQSPIEPGKRSRLWCPNDIYHVLKDNTGTDAVECISVDVTNMKELHLCGRAFTKMPNLRLLRFYDVFLYPIYEHYFSKVQIPEVLEKVSDKLGVFEWDRYPGRSLPLDTIMAENLVELNLRESQLEQLWDGVQHLPNLRTLDLRDSKLLTGIPDLSLAPNLRYVNLSGCCKLKKFPVMTSINLLQLKLRHTAIDEVPSSVATFTKLCELNFSYCESLTNLTSSICKLKCLHVLTLTGCSRLEKFPEITEPMENLGVLFLDKSGIKELPSSLIEHLVGILFLDLLNCKNLKFIPNSICNLNRLIGFKISHNNKIKKFPPISGGLRSLEQLGIDFCSGLSEIPNDIGCLSSLRFLSLRWSNIVTIPACIKLLTNLSELDISDSKRLQSLPELPPPLLHLDASGCRSLRTLSSPRKAISNSLYMKKNSASKDFKMDFTNCVNLDPTTYGNIMEEAILEIKYCCDCNEMTPFHLIIPGSEILEWFPYQSNGPSLTIQWIPPGPTLGIAADPICFVACVVFAAASTRLVKKFGHKCVIKISGHVIDCFSLFQSNTYDIVDRVFEKDHSIVSSCLGFNWDTLYDRHDVTFTIIPEYENDPDTFNVKMFGIYPIVVSARQRKQHDHDEDGEEEELPRAKRMRRNDEHV